MNKLEEIIIRKALKPSVREIGPGKVQLAFASFKLMPERAVGFFDYLSGVLCRLEGVKAAEIDRSAGVVTVDFDPAVTSSGAVADWFAHVADVGVTCLRDLGGAIGTMDDAPIQQAIDERLEKAKG